MRKIIFVLSTVMLASCGTVTMPVQSTGVEGEYVVNASNQDSIFSTIEKAQKAAESEAVKTCTAMKKIYAKKYTVDIPMRIGQVPGSTLYFTCTEKK